MPNASLDLDPSLQDLLRNADMAMGHKFNVHHESPGYRHMEVIEEEGVTSTNWMEEEDLGSRGSRKSPAAEFGSRKIGAVVLPDQLQESVTSLIERASTLHFRLSVNLKPSQTLTKPCSMWMPSASLVP